MRELLCDLVSVWPLQADIKELDQQITRAQEKIEYFATQEREAVEAKAYSQAAEYHDEGKTLKLLLAGFQTQKAQLSDAMQAGQQLPGMGAAAAAVTQVVPA